jgi:hypothetical protein
MVRESPHHGGITSETILELGRAFQFRTMVGRRSDAILGLMIVGREVQIKGIRHELPEKAFVSQTKRPDDTIRSAGESRQELSPMTGSIITREDR